MNNKINKRSISVQLKRINFNNSKNNKKELFFPKKNQTIIKNFHNTTNKYFNNINIDWEERNKKLEKKFEKICKERYDKEFGEIRNTPKIDKRSKKIIHYLEKKNQQNKKNYNSSQTNNIDNNTFIEYYKIFNNRKNKYNNFTSPDIKKPVKKISNKIKNDIKNKEEFKNDDKNYFNSINYEDEKFNNTSNKFHLNNNSRNFQDNKNKSETFFDKYYFSKNKEYFNKSHSLNNCLLNKIIPIIDKDANKTNDILENYSNKNIISSCKHLNLNKYYLDKKIKNKPNQKNNYIINLKKANAIINRRINDLKKFMLFTNNIEIKKEKEKINEIKYPFEKQNKLQKSSILKKPKKLPIGSPII